jgi:hypothetical protein
MYRNPDIPPDPLGITEAIRAVKLPKRTPTENDRPRWRGKKTKTLKGQTTVFDFLDGNRR